MIGIIADTHDNIDAIRRAVDFLNSQNVSLVLHAGDFIAPFTVKEFKKFNSPLVGVFGNNDGERKGLGEKFSQMGTHLKDFVELEHKGKRIALYHGTIEEFVSALVKSGDYNIVIRGHTHSPKIKKENGTLVINPGEVCGYLTGKNTLSILDIEKMKAVIHEI
ncbi:MAG: YfcE family phosphodiesterase [Candidatus Altiarchaeales archaeon]|nr:MAG: YfcE family phosphodiesterase [Candidatus Altiarchaeales archaeon]